MAKIKPLLFKQSGRRLFSKCVHDSVCCVLWEINSTYFQWQLTNVNKIAFVKKK